MVISDDVIQIKIPDEIIDIFYEHIQWTKRHCESGGIIIGRENLNDDNIILEKVTKPMKRDYRSPIKYIRKDKGHIDFYKTLYNNSHGIYAYFGEWHTHPQDKPLYSLVDLTTWRKISKESPKRMQYHIIVGRKYITFWKMEKNKYLPKLIKEVTWNEKKL